MSTTVDGQKMRALAGEFDQPPERTYTKAEVTEMVREIMECSGPVNFDDNVGGSIQEDMVESSDIKTIAAKWDIEL